MPRKYGRNLDYDDDDDYEDYDDYDDDDEPLYGVKHPFRAPCASELGKALFSPLPSWKLKTMNRSGESVGDNSIMFSRMNLNDQTRSAFHPSPTEHFGVVAFRFDTPSPDDKVGASSSGTKGIAESAPVKGPIKPVFVKKEVKKELVKPVEVSRKLSKASAKFIDSDLKPKAESEDRPTLTGPVDLDSSEAKVLEGLVEMTLGSDYRERGKARNSRPIEMFLPESWVLDELKRKRKPLIHLIVIGHVDAGKSTLMGHVLHRLGRVSQKQMHKNERESKEKGKGSFAYAWVLDEGAEERARGVTMTVAVAHFESPKLRVVLLDAPGHKDLVPNMISGAAQADAAVLVVDASLGAFEAGFAGSGYGSGQTREHAELARSLGVEQLIVAVNKMDSVNYSNERYEFIKGSLQPFLKQCGFKESGISWIPVSAVEGENLTGPASAPALKAWYSGPSFMDAVDSFEQPERNIKKPLRLVVVELLSSRSLGQSAVSGKLESGALRVGSQVLVMPVGEVATVKALEQDGHPVNVALAGESVDVGLVHIEPEALVNGGVLCHPDYPVPLATKLEVRVLVLGAASVILRGAQVVLHAHHAREAAQIVDLVSLLDSKTGAVIREKPRCLTANQSAVIEIVPERSICLEEYSQYKALGRVALRDRGKTLAVGIITRIINSQ